MRLKMRACNKIIRGKKGKGSASKYEQKVESSKTWTDTMQSHAANAHLVIFFKCYAITIFWL